MTAVDSNRGDSEPLIGGKGVTGRAICLLRAEGLRELVYVHHRMLLCIRVAVFVLVAVTGVFLSPLFCDDWSRENGNPLRLTSTLT